MRLVLLLVCGLALQWPSSGAGHADEVEDCKNIDQPERSVPACTEAIQGKPADRELLAALHGFRGISHARLGNFELAIADFSRAIEINPQDEDAYRERGNVYVATGALDKAVSDFSKMIEINAKSALGYHNRGIALTRKRENDRAISDFTAAINMDPGLSLAYAGRGAVYSEKGQYAVALLDLNKAIEIDPQVGYFYFVRAGVYHAMHDYDHAIGDASKAIEIDETFVPAYLGRGSSYSARKEYDAAIRDFSRVMELDPKNAGAYHGRSFAHVKKKDHDRGIADITRAIELDPSNLEYYHRRALTYLVGGKAVHGLADVDQILTVKGNDALVLDTRGLLLEDIGRRAEAIESFRAALAIDPALESSKDALKRLEAHESKWLEWQDRLKRWRNSLAAWAHTQWESPNKSRWLIPLSILVLMWFRGKGTSPGSSGDTVEAVGTGGVERRRSEQLKGFAWWGGSFVVLLAALAWATR